MKRASTPCRLAIIIAASVMLAAAGPASADTIYAGASARVITPDPAQQTIFIAGFDHNRRATGVHDDLWSRCLCLQVGEKVIAIVSVDLIGIMYPQYLQILKKLPKTVPIDRIFLTSTHNHEGPDVIGLWGPSLFKSGVNWNWYDKAMTVIAKGIEEAYQARQPAGLVFGHDEAPGLARDSRDPVVIEEQVETLQAVDLNGAVIATTVFYASHPEVLWADNTLITSDYPHYLYQHIESQVGGTAIFVSGPLGGLITPQTTDHTFAEARRIGETVASISLASLQGADTIYGTTLRVEAREIFIPLTNPLFRLAGLFGIINRPLYHLQSDFLTAVSVIELGESGNLAQIVTAPGEDFPENWFEIKNKMHAQHRIHIGMGRDELGYIVPIEDWDPSDYEESMSASKQLDPLVHNALEEMLTLK